MPDTDHAIEGAHSRAHLMTELRRETLARLGPPPEDTQQIAPRSNLRSEAVIHLGTLSLDGAGRLLATLTRRLTDAETVS